MQRYHAFDSLRGFCALWVMFFHVTTLLGLENHVNLGVIYDSKVPVSVFFILSGFVIAGLIEHKQEPYLPFLFRRYFRIAPVFVVLCVVYWLLSGQILYTLSLLDNSLEAVWLRVDIFESTQAHAGSHLLAHVSLMHGWLDRWLPFSTHAIIPPGWSITVEWQFYLIAPLLMYLFRQQPLMILAVAIAIAAFKALVLGKESYVISSYLKDFLLGMASYLVFTQLEINPRARLFRQVMATAIVVFFMSKQWAFLIWFGFLYACFCQTSALGERAFKAVFEHRVSLYLGQISYSLYLVHMLPIYAVLAFSLPWLETLGYLNYALVCFALALPLTLLASHVLYHRVEAPMMRWSSGVTKRWIQAKHPTTSKPTPSTAP